MQAGLYDKNSKLINNWQDLIQKEIITMDNNELLRFNTQLLGFLIIDNNIKKISEYAFENCNLNKIILPETVEYIGASAFQNCRNLKEINIPNNIKKINRYSFANCTSLNKIKLSKNINSISEASFVFCWNLKEMTYAGTEAEFKKINGWEHIFESNYLKIENIKFQKTLEDLIKEGKSIREANTIIKKQQEDMIK